MTENQIQDQVQPSDKEINLGRMRAKYEQELNYERSRREDLERQMHLSQQRSAPVQEEDDDESEPYVDHKKLNKKLNKFGQNTQNEIKNAMKQAKELAKEELKQEFFLDNHSDFHDVLEKVDQFAAKYPKLADNILKMPAGFERQKLVYQTIKELGMDKPEQKAKSIQETVDEKRRGPYYQPSGVGSAPYQSASDFSTGGQKQAYDKMKELQSRLRL